MIVTKVEVMPTRGPRGYAGPDAIEIGQILGTPPFSTDMGTFTGTTIPDNQTAKQNIQSLETAVELRVTTSALGLAAGAGLIGFSHSTSYAASTVGAKLHQTVSVTDAPYNAPTDGVTSANAAFTAAAAASKTVNVPAGSYLITATVGLSTTIWLLDAAAIIVGLPPVGVSQMNDTQRLNGQMIRYQGNAGLEPVIRIGDTRGWSERDVRPSTESFATLSVVSRRGSIAISGISKTSDSPNHALTPMSCIGGNFYAVNDTPIATQTAAYGLYVENQRLSGCGVSHGMEMDSVNFGPTTFDLKPSTPLTLASGYCGGIVLNSGGEHVGAINSSAAITMQWNGALWRRGIVFNSGTLDPSLNEAIAMASAHKVAWYDSAGTLQSYMDASNLERTVDSAGAFNVSDTVIRKGGAGAASPNGAIIYRSAQYGWTGSVNYLLGYTRVRQATAFSGGKARGAYEIGAYTATGVEMVVSLGGAGDNVFSALSSNTIDLGGGSNLWKAVFAGTGTIQTSDERKKTWRGGPTDADKRAARRILNELGWYQWNDAIAEKGEDGARLHFGVRAQRVFQILVDEGIEQPHDLNFADDVFLPEDSRPSFRTAFLTFDTWEEEWQDEFETVYEIEKIEVVRTRRTPTGETDDEGNPTFTVSETPDWIDQTVPKSIPTGTQIKIKDAGNILGIRADQLTMYMMAALIPAAS